MSTTWIAQRTGNPLNANGRGKRSKYGKNDRIWLAPYTADLNVTHCPVKKFLNFAGLLFDENDPPDRGLKLKPRFNSVGLAKARSRSTSKLALAVQSTVAAKPFEWPSQTSSDRTL
jgi:hypothetical protein